MRSGVVQIVESGGRVIMILMEVVEGWKNENWQLQVVGVDEGAERCRKGARD